MTNEEFRKQINNRTDDLISQIQRHDQSIANIVKNAYERGYADGKRNSNAPNAIDNAPTVEKTEEPFITVCRNTAIYENLPLYFIYYEKTGILDVYVTKTKELFEKRHCSKHLSDYEFRELVTQYLDWYSDWEERQ